MTGAKQSSIVSKCVRILDLLAEASASPGFSEIVDRCGYAKSSTHRILGILLEQGMIEQAADKTYRLGPRVLSWAVKAWHGNNIQQAALGELENLSAAIGHNVALAIHDDIGVLYLRTVNQYRLQYVAQVGDHSPLHCTAVGKVLLAYLPQPQRGNLMGQLQLEKLTENTIVDQGKLEDEIEMVVNHGYASADGEEFLQVCGIAVPVFDFHRKLSASVCIWSTRDRATLSQLIKLLPQLRESGQRISAKLGYSLA